MSVQNHQDADQGGPEPAPGEDAGGLPASHGDEGLPLPNREGSTLGAGREEETDAVGKGPRDPLIVEEREGESSAGN